MGSPSVTHNQQNGLSSQVSQQITDMANNAVNAGLNAANNATKEIKEAYRDNMAALARKDEIMQAERAANDAKFNKFVEQTMAGFQKFASTMSDTMYAMTRMMSSQSASMFKYASDTMNINTRNPFQY